MVTLLTGIVAMISALTIGVTAFVAAFVEKAIGVTAIGAMTEKPQLFGGGLILTVIPETIVIFGMVVAILIIGLG